MYAVYVNGNLAKTKKQVKDAVKSDPESVRLVSTSAFPKISEIRASEVKLGQVFTFVGPDPYNKRDFYGTVELSARRQVIVK